MMLTEEEAKTRWCPFARVLSDALVQDAHDNGCSIAMVIAAGMPHNRYAISGDTPEDTPSVHAMCVASDCMAWREDVAGGNRQGLGFKGYCGLAGKP